MCPRVPLLDHCCSHDVSCKNAVLRHLPDSDEGSQLLVPRGNHNRCDKGVDLGRAGTDDHRWSGGHLLWVIIRVVVVAIGLNAVAACELGPAKTNNERISLGMVATQEQA